MSDSDSIVSPGMVLADRYEMTTEIGRGGFGMVWKARQLNMDRDVAIKVLPPKFMAIPDVVERFKREARLASRLKHPNTITVHDYGKHENLLFIVMELLEGEDLADVLMDEPKVPIERIVHIGRQVLKSLDEAHSHGIVHRDLKPENIYLTQLGAEIDFVKVLDFGIAKLAMPELQGKSADQLRKLTMSGSTVGTPTYMSPEQAAGERVDAQTDLYALGIILWEMAMGRPPFKHDNPVKVMRSHLFEKIPSFPDKTLEGTRFEDIIRRALEKDKQDRYVSAMDFLEALDKEPSELMEAAVDEPPTVDLEPGIGSIELDPDGQDSEANIAYDQTDSYDAADSDGSSESRQSTDDFVAADPEADQSAEDSIPFDSLGDGDRVRESASANSSLTDASGLTDSSGLTDRSGLTNTSSLPPSPKGFEQDTNSTTSSIITVVEPGHEEDVILLTEPKQSAQRASDAESGQRHTAPPEAASQVADVTDEPAATENSNLHAMEQRTGGSDRIESSDLLDQDVSDDAWGWEHETDSPAGETSLSSSGSSTSMWLIVAFFAVIAAAGAAYLYYAGAFS